MKTGRSKSSQDNLDSLSVSLILKLTGDQYKPNCRFSEECSDSPFSQTRGRREKPHHGCGISIYRINHNSGIFKQTLNHLASTKALQPLVWSKSRKQHHSFLVSSILWQNILHSTRNKSYHRSNVDGDKLIIKQMNRVKWKWHSVTKHHKMKNYR